jgi:hypothetical protein
VRSRLAPELVFHGMYAKTQTGKVSISALPAFKFPKLASPVQAVLVAQGIGIGGQHELSDLSIPLISLISRSCGMITAYPFLCTCLET